MLHMAPGECLARHSSEELSEWLAFDREYGLPDTYFAVAQTCLTMAGLWASRPPKVEHFVPYFAPPPRKQTVADHKAFFKALSKKRV